MDLIKVIAVLIVSFKVRRLARFLYSVYKDYLLYTRFVEVTDELYDDEEFIIGLYMVEEEFGLEN